MMRFNGISPDDEKRINEQYFSKNKEDYFEISPRMVPSGIESTVIIQSKDSRMHLEGTYLLMVVPYYEYEYIPFREYRDAIREISVADGKLKFKYLFSAEQMYRIIIGECKNGVLGLLLKTTVYALNSDLFSLKPLIGDFHCHTICSDGFETPESILHAAIHHKLDFIAVTDHNSYQGSAEAAEIAEKQRLPITVINGEEYSSSFTNMHIISLGAPKPLDKDFYLFSPGEQGETMTAFEYTKCLCEKIKENGGLSVMCHPLWKPFHSDGSRIDVPLSLVKNLMETGVFDAIEIVGGSPEEDLMTSQMQFVWSVSYGATPGKVAYLGSTDSHTYQIDPICGKHFTLVYATDNTQPAIIEAVKNKRTVAVQIIDSKNILFYGEPRYCMFAQFYIKEIAKRIK